MRRTPVTASSTSRRRLFAVHPSPARSSRPGSAFSSGTCSIRAAARERTLHAPGERVARARVPALDPALEPGSPLLRGPVRPVLGRDPTLCALLYPIVADRGCRLERAVDVGTIHVRDDPRGLRVPHPNTRVAVSLQLHAHGTALRTGVSALSAPQVTGQVLDVVPVLVCEDVGAREVATFDAELRTELLEEPEVDVDLPVERTVERPHGRGRVPAPGRNRAVEEDRARGIVVPQAALGPVLLDAVDEREDAAVLVLVGVLRRLAVLQRRGRRARARGLPGEVAEAASSVPQRIAAQEDDGDDDDQRHDASAAERHWGAAYAPAAHVADLRRVELRPFSETHPLSLTRAARPGNS